MVPTPLIELIVGPATSTSRVMDTDVSSSAVSQMATSMLGSPSFSPNDLMVLGVDLAHVFRLIATLCERGSIDATSAKVCEGVVWGNLWQGMLLWSNP